MLFDFLVSAGFGVIVSATMWRNDRDTMMYRTSIFPRSKRSLCQVFLCRANSSVWDVKIGSGFLSHWMECDHAVNFSFVLELNGIAFYSKSKGELSSWLSFIQHEKKRKPTSLKVGDTFWVSVSILQSEK